MNSTTFIRNYLDDAKKIIDMLDVHAIEEMICLLLALREGSGRLFFLGVGGGAGHAGHAVNDFRKLAGIESYSPSDNVSELTARTNDEGWDTTYEAWLKVSRLNPKDMIFVFSVGGGNIQKNISANIVKAVQYGKNVGAKVIGVLGRDGGYTAKMADAAVIIPTINPEMITPQTESFQAVIWHLIVSDPRIQIATNKWESSV
jgi:D-sedoheptulose 7-phosphate isomerase